MSKVDEEENRARETCPDHDTKPCCNHGSFRKSAETVPTLFLGRFLVVSSHRPRRYSVQGMFRPWFIPFIDASCLSVTTHCCETVSGGGSEKLEMRRHRRELSLNRGSFKRSSTSRGCEGGI